VQPISARVRKKARRIKLLLLDVDGVLTDGRIVMDHHGKEIKYFDARDGQGIRLLQRTGIQVGIVSGRSSAAVRHRAKDLGIELLYQHAEDKIAAYEKIKRKTGLSDGEIAYVGDDLVDLPLLKRVGLAITVNDAWPDLKRLSDYVTRTSGGRGAVREAAELLLKAQRRWVKVSQQYHLA
jgi:3-deoxy-D-manno-octulosonate 8-phosphate phosphatase (KDO 8-P phosphatase)